MISGMKNSRTVRSAHDGQGNQVLLRGDMKADAAKKDETGAPKGRRVFSLRLAESKVRARRLSGDEAHFVLGYN